MPTTGEGRARDRGRRFKVGLVVAAATGSVLVAACGSSSPGTALGGAGRAGAPSGGAAGADGIGKSGSAGNPGDGASAGRGGAPGEGGRAGHPGSSGSNGAAGEGGLPSGGTGGATGKVVVYTGWPFDAQEAARRQQETAAALGLEPEIDVDLGSGISMTMVVIPAGASELGCIEAPFVALATSDQQTKDLELAANAAARCEGDELPLRDFTLPKPFVIGKTVVTVAQFNALAPSLPDDNTSLDGAAGLPAKLSYRRAQDIVRLALQAHAPPGWTLRLPTSDEWEYAARAGVVTYFGTGNDESSLAETAWYTGNSSDTLHEVGQKKPNAWGLHDMIGNSWAWIWRTGNYGDTSTDDHIVASCAYFSHPLYNECRLSNRNVSGSVANPGPQAFRFVADIPVP